jgi:hypothetical protein
VAVMIGGGSCEFARVGEQPATWDHHLELEMIHPRVTHAGGRLESRQGVGTRVIKALPIDGVAS